MKENITLSGVERMAYALDQAWSICSQRIACGKVKINKEASLQLHYASILAAFGELACVETSDFFTIELESKFGSVNIDIVCTLGDVTAAIELKCFRKASNRAKDIDMYDSLRDISRLESYDTFTLRRFICLTDNPYYSNASHTGHAGIVSIKDGSRYKKGFEIQPSWQGKWKDKSRDKVIIFTKDILLQWNKIREWYFLYLDV